MQQLIGKIPEGKRPLVLWSGGMDSSYLVMTYLERGIDIDFLYVKGPQGSNKIDQELEAIRKMREVFNKKFKGCIYNWYEVDVSNIRANSNHKLAQAYVWMFAALNTVRPL